MKISRFGILPDREGIRSVKPATVPLAYRFVVNLGGEPEAHSLDGRLWLVITPEGARKVLLLEEDTGVVLDELAVRTEWYDGAREYRYWGRGADWILFTNEVITHNGLALERIYLQEEHPLDEWRYISPTDGDPLGGRTGLYDQIIARFGWARTHTNPFPFRDDDYIPPPCLRLLKGGEGTLFLGRWLCRDGAVFSVAGRVLSHRYPASSSWVLAHENFFLPEECELSLLGGKLYGSAYRWMGRAFLYPRDFRADGSPVSTYYLLITNSAGINYGPMVTTIGTEAGRGVVASDGVAFRRGEERIEDGPWRSSDGSAVVFGSNEIELEAGTISAAVGGEIVRIGDSSISVLSEEGEDLAALISGAAPYWMNPGGPGGGRIAGYYIGPSRDMTVFTDAERFNRFTAPTNRGGTILPRQVGKYAVQDSFCCSGPKLLRSRLIREGTVRDDLTPDWDEIIKAPVSISMPYASEGEQWDMSDGPLLFRTTDPGNPSGVGYFIKDEWGDPLTVPLKWIAADGTLIDDVFAHSLDDDEMIEFPVIVGGAVKARLYKEGDLDEEIDVTVPAACAGMWKRPFATWDCKASESVGIHCNFRYTQTTDFIHAPAAMYKGSSLAGGRIGFLTFYHATVSQIFVLYDQHFVGMVADMEASAPTPADPSPGLYIPNGANWMKEYGSGPFTDSFGKTRYRENVAVIVTWNGKNVDGGGNRQWTKHRIAVIRMRLNPDEVDLAAVAANGRVNV